MNISSRTTVECTTKRATGEFDTIDAVARPQAPGSCGNTQQELICAFVSSVLSRRAEAVEPIPVRTATDDEIGATRRTVEDVDAHRCCSKVYFDSETS